MKNDSQQTPQWLIDRLGKATASRIIDVMKAGRGGKGKAAGYERYKELLVAERLTQKPAPEWSTPATRWGHECEPAARATYELKTGHIVADAGFYDHPTIAMAGASPDGLAGSEGLIEVKCPNTETMVKYVLGGATEIDEGHYWQMHWQMACTGRKWVDYCLFDPRIEDRSKQMWITRVEADAAIKAEMEREVIEFLAAVKLAEDDFTQAVKGGKA